MDLKTTILFELAVYRINEESYYKDFQIYLDENATKYLPRENSVHIENFGGQWEYNEIVGYLKFYISGKTQIRVEYSETKSKRKIQARKKTFITRKGSFCTSSISSKLTNEQIIELFEECIVHCQNRLPSKRYIKRDFFDAIYKYTDWKTIIT